jgi:DegV family protein with EDD domain
MGKSVKIVMDSTGDLPAEKQAELDITVVPLHVQFGKDSFLDGVDIDKEQFYKRMVQSDVLPTTSQPSVGAFVETYERLAQETDAILSIHLSGKMSGTVRAARQAAEMVPHVRVEVVDSEHMSLILSFMAMRAGAAAQAGTSLDELAALVQDIGTRAFTYIGFETLDHLERGGRIGHARAFLGRLMKVRPMTEIRDGEIHPLEQVRTTKRMFTRMVELTQSQGPLDDLAIMCSNNCDAALTLRDRLAEMDTIAKDNILVVQVGGVIGTHVGPGSMGIAGVRCRA